MKYKICKNLKGYIKRKNDWNYIHIQLLKISARCVYLYQLQTHARKLTITFTGLSACGISQILSLIDKLKNGGEEMH